jgi:hypothetical protein
VFTKLRKVSLTGFCGIWKTEMPLLEQEGCLDCAPSIGDISRKLR